MVYVPHITHIPGKYYEGVICFLFCFGDDVELGARPCIRMSGPDCLSPFAPYLRYLALPLARGIATRLMRCSQLCMQESFEARYVSLHVRESNRAAFHLYKTTLGYQVGPTTVATAAGGCYRCHDRRRSRQPALRHGTTVVFYNRVKMDTWYTTLVWNCGELKSFILRAVVDTAAF